MRGTDLSLSPSLLVSGPGHPHRAGGFRQVRFKFHFKPATRAVKQGLEGPLADVQAAFLGQGIGIWQIFRATATVPGTIGNLHHGQSLTRVKFCDGCRACQPVGRIECLEQEGAPAAGFLRAVTLASALIFRPVTC